MSQVPNPGQVVPGDPFGTIKTPAQKQTKSPQEVNADHARSDSDTSATAQHHTLGQGANQSSPGDHKHNGVNSKKLMTGITITGSRGGNAALASLITNLASTLGFTDGTTP